MAARLIVLYRPPDDPAAFDAHYRDVHTPIVQRYPNLRGIRLIRTDGVAGRPPDFYLMAEMAFDSRADLDAALGSEAGIESGRDLRNFAGAGVTLLVADDDATTDG
ncbi:MAG TPA: EthD family reductase [Candidatus Limnocylindria bacterium]|nr:EthD family reductase [Candidatus Limnocylindria bacterium]